MQLAPEGPYFHEPKDTTSKWVVMFVLISLLVHVILFLVILLISVFMPVKLPVVPKEAPEVSLTLQPAPKAQQPPKQLFIPTQPQPNAPHKIQPVISANDTQLTSKATVATKPDSIMPEVQSKPHASDLNNAPNVQAPPTPQPSTTPPTPRKAEPNKPTPPTPQPQKGTQQPSPQPTPQPPKPVTKPQPLVDENGLPLLPPINAQTMAPPSSAAQPLAPAPSRQQVAESTHGALGRNGDSSPAAMASALGRYKQKVYETVGSRWYPKVNNSFQLIGVGSVHIQFTIYADGTVQTKLLDGGNSTMQMLLSISLNSIRDSAPFDKFDDYPGLREELIKAGGDGKSYTDDFTFSVY